MTKKIRNVLRGKAHEYKAMVAMIAPGDDDVKMKINEKRMTSHRLHRATTRFHVYKSDAIRDWQDWRICHLMTIKTHSAIRRRDVGTHLGSTAPGNVCYRGDA